MNSSSSKISQSDSEDEVKRLKQQLEEERAAFQAFQEKTKKELEVIREVQQQKIASGISSTSIAPTAIGMFDIFCF